MTSSKLIAIKQKYPAMQVTWIINNICTNACSYCPTGLHSGKNHHYEWANGKSFVEMLLAKYPLINLSIAGGEPTLSPHLIELVKMFATKGHTVGLTTNGARSPRYYSELSSYTRSLIFSWHPSFEDPDFIEKIEAANKNCLTSIRVMMDTRHWNRAVEFYNQVLENTSWSVEPVRLQDWGVGQTLGRDYTPEQEDWFKDKPSRWASDESTRNKDGLYIGCDYVYEDGTIDTSGKDPVHLINLQQNDFRGWECNIGLESLFVHYDGDIQRGNCRQGTPTRIIGNVNEPNKIQWPTDPEICVQHECHCATDVSISKRIHPTL